MYGVWIINTFTHLIPSSSIKEKKIIQNQGKKSQVKPSFRWTLNKYFSKSSSLIMKMQYVCRRWIKDWDRARNVYHANRVLLKACFRFGRLRGLLRVSSPFAHLSLPSNVHAHYVSTRTRKEGRSWNEVRRENFANGRIIKGDSDHVSGTVHTVTSLLNGRRWWVRGWQVSSDAHTSLGPGSGFHDSPFPW